MIEISGKRRKRYVDHLRDRKKYTCLIHGPGHSSDECKVLGDFGSKYYKGRPTKERGHHTIDINKFNRKQEINAIFNHEVDEILQQKNNKVSDE